MLKSLLSTSHLSLGLALIPLVIAVGAARAAEPSGLQVTFELTQPKGAVMMALFDSQAAYDADKASASRMIPAAGLSVTAAFEGLKPGRYAVKAFQDLDGDGRMGGNPLGFPTEPFGFSNNAPVRMGPPDWAEAAFTVGDGVAVQTIKVR